MRTLSYHQKTSRNFQNQHQHKLESPHETPRYYGSTGPACIRRGTNINSSPPHETPRYCGKRGPASIRRGTNINSSPTDETFRYCGKKGNATPFRIYNIVKGGTSPPRPTDSSTTSQKTLYWGPACLTGKQLPNESARHLRQHFQPILRKTNFNQN